MVSPPDPAPRSLRPSYERGVVPHWAAPDADARTGMLIGLTTPSTVGGTSQATPLIAGIQVDAQQAPHALEENI